MVPLLVAWSLLFGAPGVGLAEQRTVTATGVGFVAGGDVAAARDGALRDAQLRALEQAVGVEVDARSVLHKELLIDDTVVTRTAGAIRTYTVVEEGGDANGLYRVRIEASIDTGTMQSELLRAAGNRRVLLVHAADAQGRGHPEDHVLVQYLTDAFGAAGFKIETSLTNEAEMTLLDEENVRRIGRPKNADIIVALRMRSSQPQCPTDNFCAGSASGSVRVFNGKTGARLAAADAEAVRGFGNTVALAADAGRRQAAEELMAGLLGKLGGTKEVSLQVAVMGLPDYASYKSLRNSLAALRWVGAVEEDSVGYHPRKSVLLVKFREGLSLFESMLSKMGRFRLLGRSGSVFTLEFKG